MSENINCGRKNHVWLASGIVIIFIFYLPLLLLQENAVFMIHDSLEVDIPYFKLNSSYLFRPWKLYTPELFNGTLRCAIQTSSFLTILLFKIFSPINAYIISIIGISLFSFIGMHLLLNRIFNYKNIWLSFSIALIFSFLPFYPNFGLSAMGLPLFYYSLWRILDGGRKRWFIPIIFYGLSSSLVYSGYVSVGFLSILAVLFILKKRSTKNIIGVGCILLACYTLTHFYTLLSLGIQLSHRSESFPEAQPFFSSVKSLFLNGQYHFASLHNYFLYPVVSILIISCAIVVLVGEVEKKHLAYLLKLLAFLLGTLLLIAIFKGFFTSNIGIFVRQYIGIFKSISFDRLYVLYPMLWYISLAAALQLALAIITLKSPINKLVSTFSTGVAGVFLFSVCLNVLNNSPLYTENINLLQGKTVNSYSWKEYFDEDLYSQIKNFIGKSQNEYKVVSIGLSPGTALYNGFYCLDGYSVNYPLEYKHQFRESIEKELAKSEECRNYFDYWGNRCYMFSSELGKNKVDILKMGKGTKNDLTLTNLELNIHPLKDLGGEYVFSAYKIGNSAQNSLKLAQVFHSQYTDLTIYLYEIL